MKKIIAIINQKGGVGKSTTAQNFSSGLILKGYSVLAVDMDAQANLSFSYGAKMNTAGIFEVLTGNKNINEAIQHTKNGDIISADKTLAGADIYISDTGKEYKLREALEELTSDYDYIVIDTPPALGILTINALTACTSLIIPAHADIFSLQGINQLAETIKPVCKYCNPNLKIDGILLTRYNPRLVITRDITDLTQNIAKKLHTKVFKTKIREGVSIKESQINQQSVFMYSPKSKVSKDYENFINEFLGKD